MDKFVIRTKRKTPSPTPDENPSEAKGMKLEKPAKIEKNLEKMEKKPEKEQKEESELQKMLKSDEISGGSILSEMLPTIKREQNKPISDEDLEKLFFALCGDTGKQYDSEDSMISEIDHMDAEEIAAKDKAFRDTIESLKKFPKEMKILRQIANIGKETEAEKEERRRMIREMKNRFKTKEQQEKDEKRRIAKKERFEKRLNSVVQVFETDSQRISQNADSPSLMTCRQFSRCLEAMAECVPKDHKNEDKSTDFRGTIKGIDSNELERKLSLHGIKGNFYHEDKSLGDYLKKKVRKLFLDDDIRDVIDGYRYDFDFTTRDCLLALETYYISNSPEIMDDSANHLSIKIKKFVESCFYVAKNQNTNFPINENLKFAMFG